MSTRHRLFEAYRAFHNQGFVPIFTEDGFDPKLLVEACVAAGMKSIEYTLRRRDAPQMIAWIRKNYPDLHVFAGSTLDEDCLVHRNRAKHPQLRTIAELADMGVDGFISATGWRLENIARYAETHVVAPTAMTITEATQQLGAGAHFIKMQGSDLSLVTRCRQSNTFQLCPVMVTGGMSRNGIRGAIQAGAILVAAGFDIMLKGVERVTVDAVAEVLAEHLSITQAAREDCFPQLVNAREASAEVWLDALPHAHAFHSLTANTVAC